MLPKSNFFGGLRKFQKKKNAISLCSVDEDKQEQ
jgi:hypothetical protein